MSHTLHPVATINDAKSKSTARPIVTEQANEGKNSIPATNDAGRASTPINGAAKRTGRVNAPNEGIHLPIITAIA